MALNLDDKPLIESIRRLTDEVSKAGGATAQLTAVLEGRPGRAVGLRGPAVGPLPPGLTPPGQYAGLATPSGHPQAVPAVPGGGTPFLVPQLAGVIGQMQRMLHQMQQAQQSATQTSASATTGAAKGPTPAQQFAAADKRLWGDVGTMSKVGLQGPARHMAQVGQFAGGLNEMGYSRAAAGLSRAALPVAVGMTAIDTSKTIADLAHDKYSTNAQLGRRLLKSLPGGEWLADMHDAITGRAAAMEEARIGGAVEQASVGYRQQLARFGLSYNPAQAGRESFAAAYRGQSPALPPVVDRSTAAGERQFQNEMKLLPFRQEVLRTEREMRRATGERVSTEIELNRLEQRNLELQREAANLQRQMRAGSGGEFETVAEKLRNVNAERQSVAGLIQEARYRVTESRGAEAGARGDVEKARLRERTLGEAEVLQGAADRTRGTAGRLGRMNVYERNIARQMFEYAQRHGLDAMTPEMMQYAESYAPAEFAKLAERRGAGSVEYRAGQAAGLDDFGGKDAAGRPITGAPAEIQRRADERRREAAQGEFRVDAATHAELANIGSDLGRQIVRALNEVKEATVQEVYRGIRQGRNQP